MANIAQQTDTFDELAPFIKMTVAPNGVTIGDLAFVSAQTHWSTALLPITTADQIAGDASLDLFAAAIGDVGQNWSTALTRTETSWLDTAGRLPANQVFIAVECAFQAFLRDSNSTTASGAKTSTLKNISALQAIGQNLSWNLTVGDGITRTVGSIGSYGGLGGITGNIPTLGFANTVNQGSFYNGAPTNGAQGATLGDPCTDGVRLRVPLVFPPNINVRIKVQNGSQFTVPTHSNADYEGAEVATLPSGQYLGIRQYLRGYLCTMPV